MKKIYISLIMAVLLLCFLPLAQAQEYGKIRALQQRAAYVTKQKNDFVAMVLTSYKIPHELNTEGVVVRINMEGKWQDINTNEPPRSKLRGISRLVAALQTKQATGNMTRRD